MIVGSQNPLQVIPREQEGFYSCWSTATEMIMEFWGKRVRQCEQSSRPGDNAVGCCDGAMLKRDPACDAPSNPEFERWGFTCTLQVQQPLSWSQIVAEIDGGRSFAFSWTRNASSASSSSMSHMLVVIGYSQTAGPETQMLLCLNPRPFAIADEWVVPFVEYKGSGNQPTGYTHEADFFGIQPDSGL